MSALLGHPFKSVKKIICKYNGYSLCFLGKKNYLPPSYLVYGFGFLFKVCVFYVNNPISKKICCQKYTMTLSIVRLFGQKNGLSMCFLEANIRFAKSLLWDLKHLYLDLTVWCFPDERYIFNKKPVIFFSSWMKPLLSVIKANEKSERQKRMRLLSQIPWPPRAR